MATYNAIKYNVDYGGFSGNLIPISTFTSDGSDSTASFTSGIDSTYKEYQFHFTDIHPSAESQFEFQGSTNSGSSYGVTITSTAFSTQHDEGDSSTNLNYAGGRDLAQQTSFQALTHSVKTDNDGSTGGILHLFEPSSTTFVKHWISNFNFMNTDPGTQKITKTQRNANRIKEPTERKSVSRKQPYKNNKTTGVETERHRIRQGCQMSHM